jgi:glycine cleavage system H protein
VSNVRANLYYSASHQWLAVDDDGSAAVGISDFAQEALGDVVFVEFPSLGMSVAKDQACAVVESVKSASDVFAPVSGTVIEVNSTLESAPEQINQAPYKAWLFKLRLADTKELETLLSAAAYQALTAAQND